MPWYICWLLIMIAAALLVMAIYTVYRLHTPRKRSKFIEQAEELPVQIDIPWRGIRISRSYRRAPAEPPDII